MTINCAMPVELRRTVLAASISLVLASPLYAADPAPTTTQAAPTTSQAVGDRTAASETKPADNTAHNARDVTGETMTPLDQSNSEADVEITRSIRKTLVDDDTLGTNAQNVKVISVDGTVTLRGAVASAEEHARIVSIAKKATGPDRVVDELEVIKR